ncbi:MAG: hypothetical protein JW778_04525 [Candidatus Altiarchaeota archaeon]|nr:hypothetical protein [Candidatus Altiarchaeota archaeon]
MGAIYKPEFGYWSETKGKVSKATLKEATNDVSTQGGSIHFFYKDIDFSLSLHFKGFINLKKYGIVSLFIDRCFFNWETLDLLENYEIFTRFAEEAYKLIDPVFCCAYYNQYDKTVDDAFLDEARKKRRTWEELKEELEKAIELDLKLKDLKPSK